MTKHNGCFNCKHSKFTKTPEHDWLVVKCSVRQDDKGEPFTTDDFYAQCKLWEET